MVVGVVLVGCSYAGVVAVVMFASCMVLLF